MFRIHLGGIYYQYNGLTFNSLRPSDAYASVNYTIIGSDNGL